MIAELSSDTFASVIGSTITVQFHWPVLALGRKLIAAGHPSSASLDVYRGGTLSLHVRSIGEAAGMRVASHGVGFEADQECTPASPRRLNGRGITGLSSVAA